MDSEIPLYIPLGIIVSLLLLAFSSASQTAYLALSAHELKEIKKKKNNKSKRILIILENSREFFVFIKLFRQIMTILLIAGTLVLSAKISEQIKLNSWIGQLSGILLLIFIIFGVNEVISKILVLKYSKRFAEFLSFPLFMIYTISRPFTRLLDKIMSRFFERYDISNDVYLSHHRVSVVENGDTLSVLDENERRMIESIYGLGETEVHEIMVPRTDIVSISDEISVEDLTRIINEKGHSRIPLFQEDMDHILGIIHAKDLLQNFTNQTKKIDLKALARPAYFVPENKNLRNLLKEFQREKHHMAIVLDEYGGTAGLITLEDIIEEIVGDIQDEYDKEQPLLRKLNDSTFIVNAKIDLHELNEELQIELPTEGEYESLGGFILKQTGYVPDEKEMVTYDRYKFIIEKVVRNRIISVRLIVQPETTHEVSDVPES